MEDNYLNIASQAVALVDGTSVQIANASLLYVRAVGDCTVQYKAYGDSEFAVLSSLSGGSGFVSISKLPIGEIKLVGSNGFCISYDWL